MGEPAELNVVIAREVRAHRHARGWTLDALASRSGVSKGALIAIEQGRGNPSIGTLVRIADALGVALARLVDLGAGTPVRVTGPDQAVRMWSGPDGSHGTLMLSTDAPDVTELWEWRLSPGQSHESEPHAPGVREVIHVLAGTLTLRAGTHTVTVAAGSTALLAADQPHGYANTHTEPVRLIMVVEQFVRSG